MVILGTFSFRVGFLGISLFFIFIFAGFTNVYCEQPYLLSSSSVVGIWFSFKRWFEDPVIISTGSSIKLLFIADDKADVYPRIAPTSEWDTCAAHAVVKYAGGKVLDYFTLKELQYNKEDLLNPYFIVF